MSTDNNPDSIYRAPESQTDVAPVDDHLAAFVGPRYESYYARKFQKFAAGGSVSWNWPAFFFTAFWLLYRKMWAYGLAYWLLLPIILATVASVIAFSTTDPIAALYLFNVLYYGSYGIISLLVMPMFANRLYYRHAKKKVAVVTTRFPSPDQQALELARAGGTSGVALIIVFFVIVGIIGTIAAISVPAYQDYTIRAQVSEGFSLSSGAKAAVAEYHQDAGKWPADNREAGLEAAAQINGLYVSSIGVEYGDVVITYGNDAHDALYGKSLVLTPESADDRITWNCYSDSIPDKNLPAMCR